MSNQVSIDARGIQEADDAYARGLQYLSHTIEPQHLSLAYVNDVLRHILDLLETAAELVNTDSRYPYAIFFSVTALEECTKALAAVGARGRGHFGGCKKLHNHQFKQCMSVSPSFHCGSRLSVEEWKMRYEEFWHKARTSGFADERSNSIYFSLNGSGVTIPSQRFKKEDVVNFVLFATEAVEDNLLSVTSDVDVVLKGIERIWRNVYDHAV